MNINHKKKSTQMRYKKLKLGAVLLLGLELTGLQAQTSINATGGDALGSGGSVSYSVGQVFYTTNKETNGSVAQGVQQPYKISVVTGIEEAKGINFLVSAYPNPTVNYLTLKVDAESSQNMSFQLYNIQGKLLQTEKLTEAETQINMSHYVPSTYFVRIISENKSIKEFKIIKN